MKIVKPEQVTAEPMTSQLFTGGRVSRQPIVSEDMSRDLVMAVVNFDPGVRNKFHAHTSDQVLIVTKGQGIVATEKEKYLVSAGDIVYFPAGEKHWHGATPDSGFSHIYVVAASSQTRQLED